MSMLIYKRNLFINVVKTRMKNEDLTATEILDQYTKLTDEEKTEILENLNI